MNNIRLELIQKQAERKFLENLKTLENVKTKEELLEVFPVLWKKKRKFTEHTRKRVLKKHIPDKNAELEYIKRIIEVLAKHNLVLIEKGKKPQINYLFLERNWVVIIGENGKIETAFKLDIDLQSWINDHIIKGKEVKENVYSREIKEACQKLRDRFRFLQ
ncbi:MAG: hypothetical protein GXO05_01145 [Aquificae bacterium]|nr:hypothetical protein [Aquificota bacterium]